MSLSLIENPYQLAKLSPCCAHVPPEIILIAILGDLKKSQFNNTIYYYRLNCQVADYNETL